MSVLVLSPSEGLGGGIERYVLMIRRALEECGQDVTHLALRRENDGLGAAKVRFASAALRLARQEQPVLLLSMHPGLLPVLLLAGFLAPESRLVQVFHGSDIWAGLSPWARMSLRRTPRLELVTVSSFSAGALTMLGREPTIIRPALAQEWLEKLTSAAQPHARRDIDLLTVCRLADWRTKGIPEFLDAVEHRPGCRAMVVGSGRAPEELVARCTALGVELRRDVDDDELANIYGRARVFVLATSLRTGRGASGEGFGIVLIEAQAAGAVVIAPRSGGSSDAFEDGVTGWRQPREPKELAEATARLGRQDHVREAQAFVRRRYSQPTLVESVRRDLLRQDALAGPGEEHTTVHAGR